MPGCFGLLILLTLLAYVASQGASVDGLPTGFVVGAVVGLLITVLGGWAAGWNAHVDEVEGRAVTRARDDARRDRR